VTEAWELGIAEAAAMIRGGELSSVELLESVIGRVAETEEYARAWAHVDAAGARAAARKADRAAKYGSRQPLLGIPLGIKDVIDVGGMPAEGGSAALRGRIATRDAGAVRRLRLNGAVILGKLQTHEFAFGQGTPPTRNPWDPERYAGGSSVGSGVAVAVGSIAGALGTDTGGSVRNPACVNGLVGLKPTLSLVSGAGVLNVSHTLDHIGPIARSVEDCQALLGGMAEEAAMARLRPVATDGRDGGSAVRLGVDRAMWKSWGVTPGVLDVVERALGTLAGLGFQIVELELPELDMVLPASLAISLSEAAHHHRTMLRENAARYLSGTRVMIETGALITTADVDLAHAVRGYLRASLERSFERAGIEALLSPTLPAIAPHAASMPHELTADAGEGSLAAALRMLSAANLTGMPAVSVPCGLSAGQPVGLHLLGRAFSDAGLLDIARAYEGASPWRSMVPLHPLPVAAK
jgi:aspartyl-tRNA(Asn)/glutamyl-tRNA(Gln) amidotransferase subunit A